MADGQVQDLVVEQIKLLRTDLHGLREVFHADISGLREEVRATNARLDQTNARLDQTNARLEVVESTLRDLAQQMVVLAHAVRATLEHRRETDSAIEDLRLRVRALEERSAQ